MDKNQPARPTRKVTCYAGFIRLNDVHIQLDFTAPVGATQDQRDAAFLKALAEHASLDYLAVGEFEMPQDARESAPSDIKGL